MKKIAFVLALMMMLGSIAAAQDVITLQQGKEIKGYVKDVTSTEVRYTSAENPDGPTYSIATKEVTLIRYQNGAVEEFKSEKKEADERAADSTQTHNSNGRWDSNLWTNQRIFGIMPYANISGVLFTGMQLGGELRYRRFAVNGFFKLAGLGAMNQSYLCNTDDCATAEDLKASGAGWTLKVYLPTDDNGASMHLGLINEASKYSYSRRNETLLINEDWNTVSKSTGFGGGYSQHKPNGLFWGVSAYCGISVFSGDVERNWDSGRHETANETWSKFFGIIEAAIGWEIGVGK